MYNLVIQATDEPSKRAFTTIGPFETREEAWHHAYVVVPETIQDPEEPMSEQALREETAAVLEGDDSYGFLVHIAEHNAPVSHTNDDDYRPPAGNDMEVPF